LRVDLVWSELSNSDRGPAIEFVRAMKQTHPNPLTFRELGELGYKFIFITLYGAHAAMYSVWNAMHELTKNEEQAQWALECATAEAAADPVAYVVADHRAHEADRQHEIQAQLAAPREEARHHQYGLLGDRHPCIAQDHEHEDGDIAPVSDGRTRVQGARLCGEPAGELGHAGTGLRGMTLTCPSSSRMA
jgi:hypothetical protein